VSEPTPLECLFCNERIAPTALVCLHCGDRSKLIAKSAAKLHVRWMVQGVLLAGLVVAAAGMGSAYYVRELEELERQAQAKQEKAQLTRQKVTLLVARENLGMRTGMGNSPKVFLVEKQFLKEDAAKGALTPGDIAKLKGKFLKRDLHAGDHITADDLMENVSGGPAGTKRMYFHVDTRGGLGGYCLGERVDIIWTENSDNDNGNLSKVLLEDVFVVGVRFSHPDSISITVTMTVEVSPEDAVTLASAMETGSLRTIRHTPKGK
jgi:Flp pilus assembly protein CpaB